MTHYAKKGRHCRNKPPKPLVYKSMSKQIYKKNPAFYTGLNQTMNQTKQPKLNHPVMAHRYYHQLFDNLPSTRLWSKLLIF